MQDEATNTQQRSFQTRDQRFALAVYQRVTEVKEHYKDQQTELNRYGAMSHHLPILIHTAGLAQAITFVNAMASSKKKKIYQVFLDDLAQSVGIAGREQLQKRVIGDELGDYLHLTREILAALLWFKRFAQSMLDVDSSASVRDDKEGN